jgi:formylglycine-generating enzyme required for sulfatase activity
MVFVKGGCYLMGDTFGGDEYERTCNVDNKPFAHEVFVDDFYIGKYPVTQKEWTEVMGSNPSQPPGDDSCPVESVSWYDVQEYIGKLNRLTGLSFRLPTEAEWEYAARSGGKAEKWAGTSDPSELGDYAWTDENTFPRGLKPVGLKKPNGQGIHDMSGNVWEWVEDWFEWKYYQNSPRDNPRGPPSGTYKVVRGGDWHHGWSTLMTVYRNHFDPTISNTNAVTGLRIGHIGFRLCHPAIARDIE